MRRTTLAVAAVLIGGVAVPAGALADDRDPFDRIPTHEWAERLENAPVPDLSRANGVPGVPGVTNSGVNSVDGQPAAEIGAFGTPFAPPGPDCRPSQRRDPDFDPALCNPAAVSTVMLPNGKVLYWNGLEGMEDVDFTIAAEFGDKALQDQTRLMDLSGSAPTFSTTKPADGGADGTTYEPEYLVPLPSDYPPILRSALNDRGTAVGALFCSDQIFLANGDVLVPGGTHYYSEPHVPGTKYGLIELEGLRNTRVYHPDTNTWSQAGLMHHGRWYPTIVTQGDGKVFVAGGVTKLIKPGYSSHPADSMQNVRQTETYDPATGKWTENGRSANHAFPLYPRLHLLPNGQIYYDAVGQVWGPAGYSVDEPMWGLTAVYSPKTKDWRFLGAPAASGGVQRPEDAQRGLDEIVAALNNGSSPRDAFGQAGDGAQDVINAMANNSLGFRGSTFSHMLPLEPPYTTARFLSAGGTLMPSPGSYLANTSSVINTVNTANGSAFSTEPTGPLNNARWFSTAVGLPTGQVIAFNGSNRDDVVAPGDGFPVKQAELFDPATKTWTPLASTTADRTYHNTAVLLPSGQVLIGGNSPIANTNSFNHTWPGGFNNNFRDSSFEIYNPPYLFWGPRPTITAVDPVVRHGGTVQIATPDAARISKVTLVRNTALTHTLDADQRTVVLPVVSRGNGVVTVKAPPTSNVAPAGPYLLFVNKTSDRGLIPSVAKQVFVR